MAKKREMVIQFVPGLISEAGRTKGGKSSAAWQAALAELSYNPKPLDERKAKKFLEENPDIVEIATKIILENRKTAEILPIFQDKMDELRKIDPEFGVMHLVKLLSMIDDQMKIDGGGGSSGTT